MDQVPATVSVIITCYNLGEFLDEAVDSVLRQTYQDFEIVIVDDGSTDVETRRLLADYKRPKTRVLRSENRGLSGARNLGIRATGSPYVTTLDADDRFVPTLLEKSVGVLDSDSTVSFVSHWLRTFGDEVWDWTPASCDAPALVDANALNGAALMRRECFEAVGGFDEQMRDGCEDWDFWLSVVEAGFHGVIIREVLYEYRRRPDSMSRLMMQGDRHARLYAHLAKKHSASFRPHLPRLLARRERETVNFRKHIHDLEREHTIWLYPEVSCRRDDVASLTRKVQSAVEEPLRRALEERTASEEALPRALEERSAAEEGSRRTLVEGQLRLQAEIDALKRSASWRVTAPLRAIAGLLRQHGGDDA